MMQFWGIEVKHGGSVKVQPGDEKVVHLSQACLGEVKKDKGSEFIRLFAQKDGQKFVIGILSLEKFPHLNLDLVFEDEFELSHDWKHGSVHFAGYKADNPESMLDEEESDDDLEESIPVAALNNGRSGGSGDKANAGVKPENAEGKPKVKIVEPAKDVKKNEDDDESDDEDEDEESDDDDVEEDEDMPKLPSAYDESEDEDYSDEEEESDDDTPKKPESSKKRPGESSSKTPVPDKKAKFATPQKTDGKKVSGHVATPHPAKHAAKTPANAGKPNQQTPKSGGSFACSSCSRKFGSDQALQSHTKAKHG